MYVREYLRFVAGIHKLGKESTQKINDVIELTGLGQEQKKKIGSLSKGYRQRVGLASTLVHDPAVLILDEATTGLDPNQIVEIRNVIANVGKEKTVLLSTHIMQEVEAICHKVIIINKGTIVMDDMSENVNSYSTTSQQIVFIEFTQAIDPKQLQTIEGVVDVKKVEGYKWIIVGNGLTDIRPLLFDCAVKQSNRIIALNEQHKSLEDVFREVTQ
jgi:ABC-2 type transport system ATP-binding protein